jgi:hypothetical protein
MNSDTIYPLVFIVVLCVLTPIMMVVMGLIGRAIMQPKGYNGWLGFLLGALGGLIGILIALVLPKTTPPADALQSVQVITAPPPVMPVSPPPAWHSQPNDATMLAQEPPRSKLVNVPAGPVHKCHICEKEFNESDCQQLSPRQLAYKSIKTADYALLIKATSLQGVAKMIMQQGGEDKPFWWVCNDCLRKCFY